MKKINDTFRYRCIRKYAPAAPCLKAMLDPEGTLLGNEQHLLRFNLKEGIPFTNESPLSGINSRVLRFKIIKKRRSAPGPLGDFCIVRFKNSVLFLFR